MPYRPLAAPSSVPCFASGSLIETPKGIRRIEDLRAGDLVLTADNGAQEIRWIGQTHVDAARLDLQPNLRPILIRAGALGCGLPARDLTVSPQHRVLVRSRIGRRLFDENEVMLAAKHLVGLPGIEAINPAEGVTYLHLLFDRHELVRSNGCLTESLFTGPQAMLAVGPAARREIQSLFPELIRPDHRPTGVRRFLTGAEARTLSERHLRNLSRRQLVETL
ncbi:Hint domain-containing protein [Paracoccus caeni]|uniref:Hint domain-containing protein n=2 Tax=Paracoccus caeni TaxID=657651 RepID=A0A934W096_9RHOB|nr:Hint domain-containing protein [Paracoccus caeni]